MAKYTATIEPVDDFGGRSKIRFGVGEQLKVTVQEDPVAEPATQMEWSVKSGPAVIKGQNPKGTAVVVCGATGGAAVLELRNKQDNSLLTTKRFEVVAPDGVDFVKQGADWHVHGFASAGFKAAIYLLPKDVSFKWVQVREGMAPLEGSGCLAAAKPVEIKGDGKFKEQDTNKTIIHPVMGTWVKAKKGGDSAKGTEMNGVDTVRVATTKPGQGKMTWRIPWFYKVTGAGGEYRFCVAKHVGVVDANGKTKMTKFNISVTKKKNDATSGTP
jgi:hypothetical protein